LDVILAWRRHEPDAIRDSFLNLLRKNRPAIAPLIQPSLRDCTFLKSTQHFVLGYFQPSAFGGLPERIRRLIRDAGS
jgi:hypothetical protein